MNFFLKALPAVAATALLASTAAMAQTTLKIATVVPDGTSWMNTMRAGVAEIKERTDGRVDIKIYAGGVQGNNPQMRRKMRIGQLHGGVFTSGGLRELQRDAEILGLPNLFRSFEEAAYVRERIDPVLMERLDEAGFVSFGFAGGGFAYLMSKRPVADRDDLGAIKLWIPEGDKVAQMASTALGISPVSLQVTDVMTGLQTELVDAVMGPPVGVIVFQWHTAMTHITDMPLAYIYASLLIDKRPWSKIAPEDQDVIREVMNGIYRGFDEQGITDHHEGFAALQSQGLELVPVADEERAVWRKSFHDANQAAAAQGEFDPELLALMECHLAVFRGESADGSCS